MRRLSVSLPAALAVLLWMGPALAATATATFAGGCFWCMQPPFEFRMQYQVNFERATAVFDLLSPTQLVLYRNGQKETIPLDPRMGYEQEISYFLDCINKGERPKTVTLEDAANAVALIEAEAKSIATGKPVKVKR